MHVVSNQANAAEDGQWKIVMGSDLKLLEDVVLDALLKSSGGLTVHQIRDRVATDLTAHELTNLLIEMRQNTFLFSGLPNRFLLAPHPVLMHDCTLSESGA